MRAIAGVPDEPKLVAEDLLFWHRALRSKGLCRMEDLAKVLRGDDRCSGTDDFAGTDAREDD